MKQSEHREKPIKRRRVQRNRRAEDRKIVIMWVKRIAVAVMVMLLLGQAYRLVAIYQEKQHIEQQLQKFKKKNNKYNNKNQTKNYLSIMKKYHLTKYAMLNRVKCHM